MGVLSSLGRLIENVFMLIIYAIGALIEAAIWAVGFVIDMAADILEWINGKLESLFENGAEEVNSIRGDALADFIKEGQRSGKYQEVSLSQLNAMNNSVINVAMDPYGNIVDDQMIRSRGGLSQQTIAQFQGQPTLKIKISA